MRNRRLIFFGTSEISACILRDLHRAGFIFAAAVSQPDRTRGRNRKNTLATPVRRCAESLGIPVLQPAGCRDDKFLDELESLGADLFCVFAFGQILPERLINMPPLGCFNAHASLLPKLRGPAPANWCIVNGDSSSGITIQRVAYKLDSGPICWQREIVLDPRETAHSLLERMLPLAAEGLTHVFRQAFDDSLEERIQDEEETSYAPKMKKEDGYINWNRSAMEIDRMVRGFFPWPAATTLLDDTRIKLYDVIPEEAPALKAEPGDILSAGKEGIRVACGEGVLLIRELQAEGKKRMDACSYLCGCRMDPSGRFGNLVS